MLTFKCESWTELLLTIFGAWLLTAYQKARWMGQLGNKNSTNFQKHPIDNIYFISSMDFLKSVIENYCHMSANSIPQGLWFDKADLSMTFGIKMSKN